jgi:GNAT superfamily N-acetyltransferase
MLKLNIKDGLVWFSFIEVLPAYRGRGIARSLVKYLFIYCRSNRLRTISFSHFTAMGLTFIRPIVKEISLSYPYIHVLMDKREE